MSVRPVTNRRPSRRHPIEDPPIQRGVRPRLLAITLILVTALAFLVGTLGTPMLVAVIREYDVTLIPDQWTLSLPFLVVAACMPFISWLAWTRRRRSTVSQYSA